MKTLSFACTLLAVGSLAVSTLPAVAADESKAKADASSSSLEKKDEMFLKKAASGGMMEVELGKIAQQKGMRAEVKSFGEMMVTDHSKANDDLKSVAAKKGVMLPTEVEGKHKATIDKLSKLDGEKFDEAYLEEMVKDHKKDVADFEKASKSAEDPEVKAFAERTLPTLRKHYEHVQGLAGKKQ